MLKTFKTIGLIGRHRKEDISDTLLALINLIQQQNLSLIIEEETATFLPSQKISTCPRHLLGQKCDLIIAVGGDGSLLSAAHVAVDYNTPVLGINRGRLGFLTDIPPRELTTRVKEILAGQYIEEPRFLLTTETGKLPALPEKKSLGQDIALNDIVLTHGAVVHMIEFSIYINDQFVCTQRADGLIIATPTGSTAYALSCGGPILHPPLDAMVLVPISPHTLSARPIVIAGDSVIKIQIAQENETSPGLSCDGQEQVLLAPGDTVQIHKKPEKLRLIHPTDYNYFQTLRSKLHWNLNGKLEGS